MAGGYVDVAILAVVQSTNHIQGEDIAVEH